MDGLQSQCRGLQSSIVLECKVQMFPSFLFLTSIFFCQKFCIFRKKFCNDDENDKRCSQMQTSTSSENSHGWSSSSSSPSKQEHSWRHHNSFDNSTSTSSANNQQFLVFNTLNSPGKSYLPSIKEEK